MARSLDNYFPPSFLDYPDTCQRVSDWLRTRDGDFSHATAKEIRDAAELAIQDALATGIIKAEHLLDDGEMVDFPPTFWNIRVPSKRLWRSYYPVLIKSASMTTGEWRIGVLLFVKADIDALVAGPPAPEPEPEPKTATSKMGRPPSVEKAVWVERLAVLVLAGKIELDDSQDSIADALAKDLEQAGLDSPKADSIRRHWLPKVLDEAKKLRETLRKN